MNKIQEQNIAPTFIDLFAGAGGLSIGLEQAGFKLLAATDWDHWSCETLRANHKDIFVYEGDIIDIDLKDFNSELKNKKIDLIVGGPPCQGFSALGKRLKSDPRNQLWKEYMRFIEYFSPKMFIIENVPEILTSEEFVDIKDTAEKLGYVVDKKLLFAVDYGVPQKRKRAFIIGSKIGTPKFPDQTHFSPGQQLSMEQDSLQSWKTVSDAIRDLPIVPDGKNWHVGRNPTEKSMQRYKSVPEGGNRFDLPINLQPECWKRKTTGSTDVFGRMEWGKPSLTIRTEFYKPEKGRYLHPVANRPITAREAARLQTFPDSYVLIGSHVQISKQIGNAVPCELARNVGVEIMKLFKTSSNKIKNQKVNSFTLLEGQTTYLQP